MVCYDDQICCLNEVFSSVFGLLRCLRTELG